jgi:hypothetical protein
MGEQEPWKKLPGLSQRIAEKQALYTKQSGDVRQIVQGHGGFAPPLGAAPSTAGEEAWMKVGSNVVWSMDRRKSCVEHFQP